MVIAFLDASAIIYLTEGAQPFANRLHKRLQARLKAEPNMRTAISVLARLECRVGPLRANDIPTLAIYDRFFARPDLISVALDARVVDLATAIRARHGLKTPDALHAACCLQLGNEHVFFTGDAAFQRVAGLHVALVS